MHKKLWLGLQFFAGEGASSGGEGGGEGAATGVSAETGAVADAGQQVDVLEKLGVPKEKVAKYRAKRGNALPVQELGSEPAPAQDVSAQPEQQAAAAETAPRDYDQEWKKIQDEPEFNRRMQDTVNKRVKGMKGMLDDLAPALEVLGRKYGLDVSDLSKLDAKALSAAVSGDDSYYEDIAAQMGTDRETAMRIDQLERNAKRTEEEAKRTIQEQMFQKHMDGLKQQAAELAREVPGFNLDAEMQNPQFMRMTSPQGGLTVRQAFMALHHDEVMKARVNEAAQRASKALSNSVQSGRSMPAENGSVSRAASTVNAKPYSQMSKAERAEWLRNAKNGKRF